jgi:hypothetical protein
VGAGDAQLGSNTHQPVRAPGAKRHGLISVGYAAPIGVSVTSTSIDALNIAVMTDPGGVVPEYVGPPLSHFGSH